MKTNKNLFLMTAGILGAVWLVIILLLCRLNFAGGVGAVGLVFGILSFVLVCGMNMLPERGHVRNDSSAFVIPFMVSVGYLSLSVLLNTILIIVASFVHINFPWISTIAIIINVLILAAFAIYSLYALAYLGGLRQKDQIMREKTVGPAAISQMIGSTIAIADNADIKVALRKLKETVDYSTNTSTKVSQEAEQAFAGQIVEIQQSIQNGDASETVIKLIDKATRTWRGRNVSMN